MNSRRLSVIVIGCGIGGLCAAVALRRAGHKVTVFEKASLSHEIGQGVTLMPNGGSILDRLGLDFEKARMVDYHGRTFVDASTLEPMQQEMKFKAFESKPGIKTKTAYRIDLHAALVELAQSQGGEGEPVEIVTKAGVESFDAEHGAVVFTSGATATADLVIAADGVKSAAAEHIIGSDCPKIDSSGTIVYRFTLTLEQMLSDRLTEPLLGVGEGICTIYVSPTANIWLVRYRCRDDGLQNFALYSLRSPEDAEEQERELRLRTDRESLIREMEGFHPALLRLAEKTTEVLPLWRCTTREPLRTLHRARMVVIGDAAHPVKPHIGMGAVSAIEDAGVLGALFRDIPSTGDLDRLISQRLAAFDKLRIGRVAAYKFYSDVPWFSKAVEEQKSNCERFLPSEDLPDTQADMMGWIMGHDAVEEAERAVKDFSRANGSH